MEIIDSPHVPLEQLVGGFDRRSVENGSFSRNGADVLWGREPSSP